MIGLFDNKREADNAVLKALYPNHKLMQKAQAQMVLELQ